MRQAENKVKIEGILSEVDIKKGSFTKNGKTQDSIGGTITVKVAQDINGKTVDTEIPVHMFAAKYTNSGSTNPAYESIERVMNEYTSIAAAGGEEKADRMISAMYEYFKTHTEKLPEFYYGMLNNYDIDTVICDYISGMSDGYAVKTFNDIFVPKSWKL